MNSIYVPERDFATVVQQANKALEVPYGFLPDDGRGYDIPVLAAAAQKGSVYRCPGCNEQLILRDGPVKIKHFAHPPNVWGRPCGQETIIHKTSKALIVNELMGFAMGDSLSPTLIKHCLLCLRETQHKLIRGIFDNAIAEYRTASGHIVDVALIKSGSPILAVEVRVSHAVDENKAKELSCPFIEMRGDAIVSDPFSWRPIRDDLPNVNCPVCESRAMGFIANCEEIDLEISKQQKLLGKLQKRRNDQFALIQEIIAHRPSKKWGFSDDPFWWDVQLLSGERQPIELYR